MKNLLCILLLLTLSGLAFGQINLPPCDPNNTGACTDYFGVANWANSPLPAGGGIASFTVQASGSGYSTSTAVFITDTAGTGATGTVSIVGGIVSAIAVTAAGSGYVLPQVTIVDYGPSGTLAVPTCGAAPTYTTPCGSGALVTAVLTAPVGGIRKFMDTLTTAGGGLTLAQADQATFPGSDYYVIGLTQYFTQMHTDLPATTLRGYCQLNIPSSPGVCNPSYLGPTIIATKNRPVRVLFKNMLPTGAAGNLFIPVDTTYMGAGAPYKQNEATLHLHGGATPWISDGTPHQWTVPAGETGQQRGVSAQLVPDMWFDATTRAEIST